METIDRAGCELNQPVVPRACCAAVVGSLVVCTKPSISMISAINFFPLAHQSPLLTVPEGVVISFSSTVCNTAVAP